MGHDNDNSALIPARYQPALPLDSLIVADPPNEERVELDVLIVGAGPAGLASAIELAKLVRQANDNGTGPGDISIGVLEKAEALGEHCLSGAVVNPRALHDLLPDVPADELPFRAPAQRERFYYLTSGRAFRLPAPPPMKGKGYQIASVCEIVRWLGERAEAAGVDIFTGFPAAALLVDGDCVSGVRTAASGLDRDGNQTPAYAPPTDVTARVTVLAEGTRGTLAQAYLAWQDVPQANPQVFSLGVKELWETKQPLDGILHTMGWPLPASVFGGSFMYPLEPRLLAVGLVVGLDYRQLELDVHDLLQQMKAHPLFSRYLAGGEMVEWGAKTIPEGGYYAVPQRRHGDGVVIVGDSAGFVDVPSLKGIHYAIQSGIFAARAVLQALTQDDASSRTLAEYDELVDRSYIMKDLHRSRNVRAAFSGGLFAGAARAGLATITGGRLPAGRIAVEPDAHVVRSGALRCTRPPDGSLSFAKLDAVYKSGNATRDTIPSHLLVPEEVPPALASFYEHMCPAAVYEQQDGGLAINPPNCVDCKATDVLGPRWLPREGGSGPKYRRM